MPQINHEMGQEICAIFPTDGCTKQFHIVKKIHPKPKVKGHTLGVTYVQKMTDPAR
jgi:hypothetical protein